MMSAKKRVLSVQSHVVHGYVGNKSATFPLQVLGFDVDAINSVQFSNHTGYGSWKGQILDATDLEGLFDGLKGNQLLQYSHLLTGYIGSKSFLIKVAEMVSELKQINPNLLYVCDPVMGDHGKMYVPPDLLPVYREHIIPKADIITPNQFEAELLTGITIDSPETAHQAMQCLHDMGAKTVVISSSNLGNQQLRVLIALTKPLSGCVLDGHHTRIKIEMPFIPAVFTGTGDLFSALLLAWLHIHSNDLKLACEKTVSTLQHVLRRTLQHAEEGSCSGQKPCTSELELRLIQSKSDIENPELGVKATVL